MTTVRSTEDAGFQSATASAIARNGEVLAMFRFHAGAGSRSLEFFTSMDDLNRRMAELPPRTSVIVFAEPQFHWRGRVDEHFVSTALRDIADGTDWWLVRLTKTSAGSQSWFHDCSGNTHEELNTELRDEFCWGERVAVGHEPDWLDDSDTVFSAVTPDSDGAVRIGVY